MSAGHTQSSPFPTTHWTHIHALQKGSAAEKATALETICQYYWYPIYAFLRRSGQRPHDAEDLTQAFFEKLISEEAIHEARKEEGRLRSYLLGVLKRQLSDWHRDAQRQKRGGQHPHISFEEMDAEERYACEPQDVRDPELIYTRTWAGELLRSVREKLRETFAATGRADTFNLLLPFLLWDEEPPSHKEIAQKLGGSEAGTRILIFRLRTKFRDLLREEIARTVLGEREIAGELAWLQSVLAAK